MSNFYLFWPVFHESIRLSVADADLAASPDSPPAHDGDGGASEKEAAGEGPAGKTNIEQNNHINSNRKGQANQTCIHGGQFKSIECQIQHLLFLRLSRAALALEEG